MQRTTVCVLMRLFEATFEAEFMKKLSNTDDELKKSVAYKKACIGQKALSQSNCRIFESTISPDKSMRQPIFCMFIQFDKIKS